MSGFRRAAGLYGMFAMKKLAAIICSAAMTIGSIAAPIGPAAAAPIQPLRLATPAPDMTRAPDVEQVRIRRFHRGFYNGPRVYRRGPFRHRAYRRGWRSGWGPGAFIAGAIIAGALAAPPYRYGYYRRHYPYPTCNTWRGDCY